MDKLSKEQIAMWTYHPVTIKMMEIIESHKKANEMDLNNSVINGPSFKHLDLHLLSQLKGQILALEEVLDIKTYLIEAIEDEDEISSVRGESTPESK